MPQVSRYLTIYISFIKFSLITELSFKINFLIKIFVELLWLSILIIFYEILFSNTDNIAHWSREQYLFFIGCHYMLGGIIESLFLENCANFTELVRSGDLDTYLLKPIDEQFIITTKKIDWSTLPNIIQGIAIMIYALAVNPKWTFELTQFLMFVITFTCGLTITYSFLLMLCSTSVWIIRNQSMMELWWLFSTLMRYPKEIFNDSWAHSIGWFLTFVIPALIVINIPASTMIRKFLHPYSVLWMGICTGLFMFASRKLFKFALTSYRSASS